MTVSFVNGLWSGKPEQGGHVTFACPFWNGGLPFTCRTEDVLSDGRLIEVVDEDGKVIVPVVGVGDGEEGSQEIGGEKDVQGLPQGSESPRGRVDGEDGSQVGDSSGNRDEAGSGEEGRVREVVEEDASPAEVVLQSDVRGEGEGVSGDAERPEVEDQRGSAGVGLPVQEEVNGG